MNLLNAMLPDMILDPRLRSVYADGVEDSEHPRPEWTRDADRVSTLTAEQAELIPAWRDHWLTVGLATGPCDHGEAMRWASEAYKVAGLEPPTVTIWLDSPLRGAIRAAMLSSDQVEDQVWDQVRNQVWDQVRDQVGKQVREQVRNQVRDQVEDQVWEQVRDQVRNQVRDQIEDQVRDHVEDHVEDQVRNQVWKACYGAHDTSWLSFYSFLGTVCGLRCCDRLLPMMHLAHLVGWWWPFRGTVIFTPRPTVLKMSRKKLVEISYQDGWGFCSNQHQIQRSST